MLKPHRYWDGVDYDQLLRDDNEDTDDGLGITEKDFRQRREELEKLKAEAKRYERAAKVAALKSKGKRLSEQARLEEEVHAKELAEQADRTGKIGDQFEKFLEERSHGLELLKKGRYEEAEQHLVSARNGIDEMVDILGLSFHNAQGHHQHTHHSHSHGHGECHGHGHDHEHEHGHDHGQHDHHESKEEPNAGKLDAIAKTARKEVLLLLGQCYLSQRLWVKCADVLRDLLLLDRDIGFAWVLRGTAFLEMNAPLLADLHLNQSQVKSEAKHVVQLKKRISKLVQARQTKSLEENVHDEVQQALKRGSENSDFGRLALALKEEGDRLRMEQFYFSASIKFLAALDLTRKQGETADMQLVVSCLLSEAACSIERGANLKDAMERCSEALQLSQENPKALFYRSQAHRELGQYGLALEDLIRAKRACVLVGLAQRKEAVPWIERIHGLPEINFFGGFTNAKLHGLMNRIDQNIKSTKRAWSQLGQVSYPKTCPAIAAYVNSAGQMWPIATDNPYFSFSTGITTATKQEKQSVLVYFCGEENTVKPSCFPEEMTPHVLRMLSHSSAHESNPEKEFRSILRSEYYSSSEEKSSLLDAFESAGYHVHVSSSNSDVEMKSEKPALLILQSKKPSQDVIELFLKTYGDGSLVTVVSKDTWLLGCKNLVNPLDAFQGGDKVEVLDEKEGTWSNAVITKIDNGFLANVVHINGREEERISIERRIRKREQSKFERETILTNSVDVLPTMFGLAIGQSFSFNERHGRDLSGFFKLQESGRNLIERGNRTFTVNENASVVIRTKGGSRDFDDVVTFYNGC